MPTTYPLLRPSKDGDWVTCWRCENVTFIGLTTDRHGDVTGWCGDCRCRDCDAPLPLDEAVDSRGRVTPWCRVCRIAFIRSKEFAPPPRQCPGALDDFPGWLDEGADD